jgi:hypothetical protein
MSTVQPDLFGEYDAEQQAIAQRAAERTAWAGHFTHADVSIAYQSQGGDKPGDVLDGIVCPACGGIEFNAFLLGINHGWSPDAPQRDLYGRPAFETCTKLLLIAHGRSDVTRDGIGVVRTAGAA